ncbi:MAG: LamG-like jellyroll fold domain-containing protein [Nocardioidaceae bacterium]
MSARFSSSRALGTLLLAVATAVTGFITLPASGAAPAAMAAGPFDPVMSGTASPMWQTNNSVKTIESRNGIVYAGGLFTAVRPPGAAAGTNQTTRTYLAAFNANTGALVTGFNVTLNGAVNRMAFSPDGSKLYIAGAFTTVNGVSRRRFAAINLPSGTLNTQFNPNSGAVGTAIAAYGNRVYVSGDFLTIGGVSKMRTAMLDATTGAVLPGFVADIDARANIIKMAPDGSRVLMGGNFTTVNGTFIGGMSSLDPDTGALEQWDANTDQPINTNCSGRVSDLVVGGDTAYVTGEGDPPGCYEGTYSARISDGHMNWNSSCLGASQGIALIGNVLYKGSHEHDCAFNPGDARGGFVGGLSRETFQHWHMVAQDVSDGSFLHWTPDTNGGKVGPLAMGTDGSQIFVGGDFRQVEGVNQQGLARFAPNGSTATPKRPGVSYLGDPFENATPIIVSNLAITVQPTAPGTLSVEVPTVEDVDSGTLTYRIFRDGSSTAAFTTTVESYPWSRPVIRWNNTGLAPGSTHSYRVSASDGVRTSALSTAVSGTVATVAPPAFADSMSGLTPSLWWRLDDSDGTAADSGSGGNPGSYQGGVTLGQPGIAGNAAPEFDGSTGYVASSTPIVAPSVFSMSAWFKTSSIRGGTIVAQSTLQTGPGGTTDRLIAMDNNGGIAFGIRSGRRAILFRNQGPIWNDGQWHQVVLTYDGNLTANLYVDGKLQGSPVLTQALPLAADGYLRVGYADLAGIQLVFGRNYYNRHWPTSDYFTGNIDEVAFYPTALTADQVQGMYASGMTG